MVKPDVKVNYYAALELGNDASVDDIKKQYRKLALKYHPDRNPGKEEEFNAKFQAISAAHEILSDPATKATYDTGRRGATLSGGAPRPAASGRTGNPYTASSNFAPPPRRTQDPTGWSRPAGQRYTNFPGPSPTAKTEAQRASFHDAWSAMGGARRAAQKPATQFPPNSTQGQRRPPPPPPVPPRDNQAPPPGHRPDLPKREADIRAGFKHRQAPSASTDANTAWAHFNPPRAEASSVPRPGLSRSNTSSRTPKRNAFDPNTPGSDERPTSGGTAGYTSHYKASSGVPQSSGNSSAPGWTKPQDGGQDGQPPYSPTARTAPYQQYGGEKLHLNPDHIRRSNSTRDTTRLNHDLQSPRVFHNRHRSASPPKSTASAGMPNFSMGDGGESTTSSASSASSDTQVPKAGAFGTNRRPKINPTPPSTRMNGASSGPSHQPPRANSASAQGGQGQNGSMYENPFHLSDQEFVVSSKAAFEATFGVQATARKAQVGNHSHVHAQESSSNSNQDSALNPDGYAPLVDVFTSDEDSPSVHRKSYVEDLESLGSELYSEFNMKFDFDNTEKPRSRSTEHIDTAFSASRPAPTFAGVPGSKPVSPSISRKSSPPKRPRETLSARGSRNYNHTRMASDQSRTPVSPTSAQHTQLFGEIPTSGSKPTPFTTDQWQDHQFFGPQSGQPSRNPSHSGAWRGATAPQPATVSDATADGESSTAASGGDAMDVDPAPPAGQQQTSPPLSRQPTARTYAVPLSQWRRSQGMPPPSGPTMDNTRRRSSVRSVTDPPGNTMPDLTPLSSTLNQPTGQGLNDLSSLSSSIPFQSRSSNIHPDKLFNESQATPSSTASGAPLPALPIAPPPPQKLTASSWREYIARFQVYLSAYHQLQRQFVEKSQAMAAAQEKTLHRGPAGLDAKDDGRGLGIEGLLDHAREEERWNQLRELAGGRYKSALGEFVRLKTRVWDMRDKGILVE